MSEEQERALRFRSWEYARYWQRFKGSVSMPHASEDSRFEDLEVAPPEDWKEQILFWKNLATLAISGLSEGWLKEHKELMALRFKHKDFDRDLENIDWLPSEEKKVK